MQTERGSNEILKISVLYSLIKDSHLYEYLSLNTQW